MKLYSTQSSDPKSNAQRNLVGRTHYVDDDTLGYHKSRILSSRAVDHGLLFAIVESVALDMNNTRRGCRYVIFDVFGHVVGKRQDLENCWKRSEQATKAMWQELNAMDAKAITLAAIEREKASHAREMVELVQEVERVTAPKVAA